ncbi:MAG: hypothetical protein LBK25_05865 [Treponema sp.]|jgi:hypothetical protein|nr:hypothetical protein [Treponema sp.]
MNESPRDSANFICLNEINCEIPLDRHFLFKIEKKALCSNVLDPLHTEYIHFITPDARVKEAIRKFHLEKNLPFMKIRMSVHSPDIDEEFDIINRINLQYEYKMLKYKLELLDDTYRRGVSFAAAFLDLPKLDKLIALARSCSDFESYCDILSVLAKNYLVIAAVKDTPGSNIPANILEKLRSLGLTDFDKTLWKMYIGVIYKGVIIAQKYGEPTKAVEFAPSDKLFGLNIRIGSHAWSGKGGKDKAEIIVDGTDFAVNARGINIVVYDAERHELIDRVAFDWHDRNCVCKR